MASTKKKKKTGRAARPAPRRAPIDVRQRVHDVTVKALRDGELSLRDIPKLAQEAIESAAAGLNRAVPQSSRNVLRQVVDGLNDAAVGAARSTRTALGSMAARGSEFIRSDASRAVKDIRELEGDFVSALERAARSLRGAARDELNLITRNARRAQARIRPGAEGALKAADGRLLELGKEAADASGRAVRSAVVGILQGASGLLQGVGDAVKPRRRPAAAGKKTSAKKRGGKKAARKKPAAAKKKKKKSSPRRR